MYELVRTVDHVFDNGDETILKVIALVTDHEEEEGKPGCAVITSCHGNEESILVFSVEQANRLHRALLAALSKAGHWVE